MTKTEKKALKWVNEQRKMHGQRPLVELPRGYRADSSKCVIANAFKDFSTNRVSVTNKKVVVQKNGSFEPLINIRPPLAVKRLIARFDNGVYPHLVQSSYFEHYSLKYADTTTVTNADDVMSWREKRRMKKATQQAEHQIFVEKAEAARRKKIESQIFTHASQLTATSLAFMYFDMMDGEQEPISSLTHCDKEVKPLNRFPRREDCQANTGRQDLLNA